MAKPPIKQTANARESQLKYFSIKGLIASPFHPNKPATIKNRADRLTVDAMTKPGKLMTAMPAEMVHTLYGNGVNPQRKTIKKSYWSYQDWNLAKFASVIPAHER